MFKEWWNITFREKLQSIQAQLQILDPRDNPVVQVGRFQWSDVTTAPLAHTSDVTFSNFNVSQLAKNSSLFLCIFVTIDKGNTI